MSFKLVDDQFADDNGQARFTVFGVGGGGGNAVEHMVCSGINGVTFICANTDKQALDRMSAPIRLQLGGPSTRGLGAGANPEVGRLSAEEERQAIQDALQGADMVFVTAGMGGGTGTGAAPVIASIAKDMGILTVGVVTTPFMFEGRKRAKSAEAGIAQLADHVDSLIIIPNEKLLTVYGDISMKDAFKKADDVLLNAVRSIFDLIVNHGHINLDFADLKTAMSTRGYAMMGIGTARGDDRARQAAEMAIRSPLLDNIRMENAKGILINITSADDVKPSEVNTIAQVISQIADMDEGDIFYGTVFDPDARDELRVTVIATGLTRNEHAPAPTRMAPPARMNSVPNTPAPAVVAPKQPSYDDDDAPAISRRQPPAAPEAARPTEGGRPSPLSIQDYLKNQQKR
jgi:cell division protein FtsZ